MPVKIGFLGVYRDLTGYGHAATDYILALDSVGVDVVARPIKLNELKPVLPERLLQLEQKTLRGCDIVIQHILPHMMEYSGAFKKNIALFELETNSFDRTYWPEYINMMDIAWLTSTHALESCKASNIKIPVELVLHTTDTSKYNVDYPMLEIPQTDGEFIFYTIAEMNTRKNLVALLRAFHSEFDPNEPVSLLIKASRYEIPQAQLLDQLQNYCMQIKQGLNIYPKVAHYKPEILVTNVVDDNTLYKLHNSCDCFVLPSCGEAWCYPAFDAMAFGKTPIVTNWSGFTDYMTSETGWLVDYHMQQAFGGNDSHYSGHEQWASVDIMHLRKCMREAYENKTLREEKAAAGKERAQDFSYKIIGNKLKGLLESYV